MISLLTLILEGYQNFQLAKKKNEKIKHIRCGIEMPYLQELIRVKF